MDVEDLGHETNKHLWLFLGWKFQRTDEQPELGKGRMERREERLQQPDRLHGPASIGRLRWLGAGENKVEHFHHDKVTVAALIYLRQRPKGRTPRGH